MVQTNLESTKSFLYEHPQLSYALFHAMISMNLIDPLMIQQQLQGFPVQQPAMNMYQQQQSFQSHPTPTQDYQQEQQNVVLFFYLATHHANNELDSRTNQYSS